MAEEGVKLQTKGRVQCAVSTEVDGDIFSFRGGSTGIVKILEPVSPLLNYFEYLILDRGREASIGIGVGERNYPTGRMPGWNRNSCGYHADDGKLYHENGMGRAFGPTCTNGDRMGCGVDFDTDCGPDHVNIFFTKNGRQVGEPVRMKKPIYGLYPLIGLHSRGERVHYLGHWQRTADGSTEPMEQDNSPGSAWLRCNQVRFLDDGLTVEYAGHGGDVQDIGIAQASGSVVPVPVPFPVPVPDPVPDPVPVPVPVPVLVPVPDICKLFLVSWSSLAKKELQYLLPPALTSSGPQDKYVGDLPDPRG